jgi:hypothetical protein
MVALDLQVQAIALGFVAAFAAWTIPKLPVQAKQHRTVRERIDDLDIPGMITGVLALVLVNFSWNQATVVTWMEPYVYVCLILGILFGAAFFCIEVYWAKHPILPIAAFNVDIAFVFACTGLGWACFGIWVRPLPHLQYKTPPFKLIHACLTGFLHVSSRTKHRRQYPSPNGSMVHPRHPLRSHLLPRSRKASR